VRVHIPSALRKWSAGRDIVELYFTSVSVITAGEVIETVAQQFPGLRDRVLNEQGELRRHVNIFIDGENVRFHGGLSAPVGADSEMWIHPALSGGWTPRGFAPR
jgi:sulfur-carrier protein